MVVLGVGGGIEGGDSLVKRVKGSESLGEFVAEERADRR
jgi:hypothetical protein